MVVVSSLFLRGSIVAGLSAFFMSNALAQSGSVVSSPNEAQFEEQRQQQREALQQATRQSQDDVRLVGPELEEPSFRTLAAIGEESPCFPIKSLSLEGQEASRFQFALEAAITRAGFKEGQCVGVQGIELLSVYAQNALIDRGYTTSRVVLEAQDLSQGHLRLTLIPGYVGEVILSPDGAQGFGHARMRWLQNEMPVRRGEVFNLRDIEQGLENYRRLPTAQTSIRIEAADRAQYSDVHVDWQQRHVPFRLSMGFDNSGSRQTGRYIGTTTFSGDGLLGLSDLFYVSYNRSLGDRLSLRDDDGHRTKGRTDSYSLHYSIPWGYWQFFYNQSYYRYHQAVAGAYEHYDYNGRSLNRELGVSRTLYRDQRRKTQASFKLWQRRSNNYIADAEIDVQRKKMGGWQASVSHKEFIGANTIGLDLSYRRGTGIFNSEQPAEHLFGEGTSRMRVLTADVNWSMPFTLGQESLVWDSRVHAQWHKSPLVTQDQLAIGGRYSVRGFDGELYLMAERGWYWRNDVAWQYRPNHQVYVGADVGRVSGPSSSYLLGQTLAGAVIGLRGQLTFGSSPHSNPQGYYDFFVGTPIKKPSGFKTKRVVIGFSLNFSY